MNAWRSFKGELWQQEINVRAFIQENYQPYEGGEEFLAGTTEKTRKVWEKSEALMKEEIKNGIIDIATEKFSSIDAYGAGYIDQENEVIVGFQADAPLKRLVNPYGGFRMVKDSLAAYHYDLDETMEKHFTEFRKTHNEGVFDAYTDEMKAARTVGLLTGLPDAYGRGRIIGD